MNSNLSYIGANIRRLRIGRGWTQQELATRAGISRIALIHIEHTKALPSLETALSLASVFDVSISKLLMAPVAAERTESGTVPAAQLQTEDAQSHEHELESLSATLNRCTLSQLKVIRKVIQSTMELFSSNSPSPSTQQIPS